MKQVKVGLVGCGDISGLHVLGWRTAGAEVVAIADSDAERLTKRGEEWQVAERSEDYRELLAREDIDLVSICTPPGLHLPMILDTLHAGKWAYCEKPLVGSLADFDRVAEAEAETGRYCTSVFQVRNGIAAVRLREQMAAGMLGRLYVAELRNAWRRDDAYYAVPWRGKWSTELGGTLMSHGIHGLDLLVDLAGPVVEIDCMADHLARHIECEDTLVANLRCESGAFISILMTVLDQDSTSFYRFAFEHATVDSRGCRVYGPTESPWYYTAAEGSPLHGRGEELAGRAIPEHADHAGQMVELVDCYRRNARPPSSGPSVRHTLEVVAGMYKSMLTGERVRLPIANDDPFHHSMNGGMLLG